MSVPRRLLFGALACVALIVALVGAIDFHLAGPWVQLSIVVVGAAPTVLAAPDYFGLRERSPGV